MTGILSFPNELLMDIRDYLDLDNILELRTTTSRFYVACHGALKTIYVRGSFPRDLRLAGFNGVNFHPEVIKFVNNYDDGFELDTASSDFLETFGAKKCRTLVFSRHPGDKILSYFLEILPNVVHLQVLLPKSIFERENYMENFSEVAKLAISRLKSCNFSIFIDEHPQVFTSFPSIISSKVNLESIDIPTIPQHHHINGWMEYFVNTSLDVIEKNATKLRSLRMNLVNNNICERLSQMKNLMLTHLAIEYTLNEENAALLVNVLKVQTKLQNIELSMSSNIFPKTIETSCQSLKSLTLAWFGNQSLDFSFMHGLVALKNLEIKLHNGIEMCYRDLHVPGLDTTYSHIKKLKISRPRWCSRQCTKCAHKIIEAFPGVRTLHTLRLMIDPHIFGAYFSNSNVRDLTIEKTPYISSQITGDETCMHVRRLKLRKFFGERCGRETSRLKYLPQMPNLLYLHIGTCEFTIESLPIMAEKFPNLTKLHIHYYVAHKSYGKVELYTPPHLLIFDPVVEQEDYIRQSGIKVTDCKYLMRFNVGSCKVNVDNVKMVFEKMTNLLCMVTNGIYIDRKDYQ